MYCPNCGGANAPTNNNCTHCGTRLPDSHYTPSRVDDLSHAIRTDVPMGHSLPDHERIVYSRIKELCTGPVFIVAIICYCLTVLIQLVDASSSSLLDTLTPLLEEMGVSAYAIEDSLGDLSDFISGLQFIALLPGLMTAIGLVILFCSAISYNSTSKISTAGLTIIQILQTASLVIVCVTAAFGLFIILSVLEQVNGYTDLEDTITMILLIYLLAMGFVIAYQSLILKTISTAKRTLETGIADSNVSAFVGVMCCISGGFTILSMFSSEITMISLLSGVATLLFGVVIFLYRSAMSTAMYTPTSYAPAAGMAPPRSDAFVPTWKRIEMEENNIR